MKKIFKRSILIVTSFIIGSIACISIGVYAYSYAATDIEYTSGKSVKQAVDDLYSKYQELSIYAPHYAFGVPNASSTSNYNSIGKNVLIRLFNGVYGACLIKSGTLYCFDSSYNNSSWNYDTETTALKSAFNNTGCTIESYYVACNDGTVNCGVFSTGGVSCGDSGTDCGVDARGNIHCS